MKKSKFTESQIAFAIKQSETGTRVEEVCRKMGISEATFYNWKKKYGGLGVSELRKLRQLEDAMEKIEIWREEYNTFRPHSCLGDMTPEMFIKKHFKTAEFSTLEYS
ncbi:transposase [Sphingobacterium paramultivorum]|uniref:Transposase n=1 Tax=Sphingobacterium paramultivorum TaxID=2886510 RepID=A0A7G5E1T3_9SPHI|nr:transposase [Sphingobacterium paramultivorum]QMV67958.1 transposase [Sphingobacterium paramultivorum]WSO16858.1 transposase [Sphingobacterium paramultivorum]